MTPEQPTPRTDNSPLDEAVYVLTPIQLEIVREISKAFTLYGAGYGMNALINSWGDTLPESEILKMLKDHNKNFVKDERQPR